MAITHLYTRAELDTKITALKLRIESAEEALSLEINTGGTGKKIQRERVDVLQTQLEKLQSHRVALEIGHGAQSHIGRPAR